MKIAGAVTLILAGVFVTPALAATLHVPSDFGTINEALDASVAGDTVLVAPGMYTDFETRGFPFGVISSVAFLKGGVTLRSELGREVTTLRLDGTHPGGPVIAFAYLQVGTIHFEGFTLSGVGDGLVAFDTPDCDRAIIRDCDFVSLGNGTTNTGGVGCNNSNQEIYSCRFIDIDAGTGGAIYQESSTLLIEDCEFRNVRSGAVELSLDAGNSHPAWLTMRRCVFIGNEKTTGTGGAISVGYPQVLIEECLFENNRSVGSSNAGGAIGIGSVPTASQVIRNCTFVNNWITTGKSAAVRSFGGPVELTGNTFYGNHQSIDWDPGGSSVYLVGGAFVFRNNVVVNSQGDQAVGISSGTMSSSCNIFFNNPLGHTSGFALDPTDLVVDPLFCNPSAGDFHVDSTSLCLPANNPSCDEPIGAWPQGCGTVSVEPESWGRIKERYRATPEENRP